MSTLSEYLATRSDSAMPQHKVVGAGISGAITSVLLWLVQIKWPELVIPPEIASAITVIVMTITGYIVPPGQTPPPTVE